MSTHTFKPDMPPPNRSIGVVAWMRANMFSSWLNTLLTLFAFYLIYLVVPPILQLGDPRRQLGRHQPGRLHQGGRLLGVHPAALRPVHVRLLPAGTALARGPDRVAGGHRRGTVVHLALSRIKRCTA